MAPKETKKIIRFAVGLAFLVLLLPIAAGAAALEFFPAEFDTQIALASGDPRVILARIINAILLFLGVGAVVLVLYGGFLWMTAAGNEERIGKAKKVLVNAAIGLVIIFSSFAIARFVIGRLLGAIVGDGGSYQGGGSGIVGYLPKDAFVVRGITPMGPVLIRNIAVRVVLNRAPNLNTVAGSVVVRHKSDGAIVDGVLTVSGSTIKFVPTQACPSPNNDRKCFDIDTDYTVEVSDTLESKSGKALSCGGFAPSCDGAFRSGSVVDVTPPDVTITSPDPGESVPVDPCVTVQALVKDDGGISSVEFYADGDLIEPDGTAIPEIVAGGSSPTEATTVSTCWDTTGLAAPSTHLLKAKAYDIDENEKTSAPVRVVVRPLHCFNEVLDDEEDGIDCDSQKDGPSGCGLCDGVSCADNEECAGGNCDEKTKTCVSYPKISGVTPGDGRPGTFVTLFGSGFGVTPGRVIFTDNKDAQAPAACSASGSWTPRQVLVGVPDAAADGSVKLCTAGANPVCDATNDERGPIVPVQKAGSGIQNGFFDVNEVSRPGLCLAYSPTPNTACTPGPGGDGFCQKDNKDPKDNPDASAFCHKVKKICVFPKGVRYASVYLEGVQFGQSKGYISFSGQPSGANVWSDTNAETILPPLTYGGTKVQAIAAAGSCQNPSPALPLPKGESQSKFCSNNASQSCGDDKDCEGLASNAVGYVVLSPDAGSLPVIDLIDPAEGGPGSGITLYGKNFGETPGIVWFQAPDGRRVYADTSGIPEECASVGGWWTDTSITVKVPRVPDIYNVDNDNNKTEALVGKYEVFLRRKDDSEESNKKDFVVNTTPPGPMIWCLDPAAGPAFTNVTVYGERFGALPTAAGRGVFFAPNLSQLATLVNVSGTPGGLCPSGGWSDKEICAQVPAGATTGNAVVKTFCQGDIDCDSNKKLFVVGACKVLPKIGDAANPAYAGCRQEQDCCADGVCRAFGKCSAFAAEGGFGWEFTTRPTEIVPQVIEECISNVTDTSNLDGKYASPSPWAARDGGDKACTNAQVSARFTAILDPLTLRSGSLDPTVILQKCGAGVDTENLFQNGGFESVLGGQWSTVDAVRLTLTRVGAPQDDLADDGQAADGTVNALRLEKRQAEPDRTLGQTLSCSNDQNKKCETNTECDGGTCNVAGLDGNDFRESFAAVSPMTVGGGKSYTFSARVKAAETSDGKLTAATQKAGILVQIAKADGTVESKYQETELNKDTWNDISLSFSVPLESGIQAQARLYLTSPSADTTVTDYHKYAAYFDDVKLLEHGAVVCRDPQDVTAKLMPNTNSTGGINGFSLLPDPAGTLFVIDTWYRVTLTTGIKAQGQPGIITGANMKEDAARCGAGNAYCWLFRTSASKCEIGNIWTVPNPYTAHTQFERINYSAIPVAKGDACINLNPAGYAWRWESSAPDKAAVGVGRACVQESDCAIGPSPGFACLNGYCAAMPWTATATAKLETLQNVPVKIIPQALDPGDPSKGRDCSGTPECSAQLFITFADPKVVEYWPACDAACRNAEIGAKFNIPMDPGSFSDNVLLYEIACGNGKPDSGEDCDDGNLKNGDGCSETCLHEGSNFVNRCGNGDLDFGEDCDDKNIANNDGCSAKCLNEGVANTQTEQGIGWSRGGKSGVCGNAAVEKVLIVNKKNVNTGNTGEDCDDGNTLNGDGCSERCLNEGTRSDIPVCGNSRVEKGEECDKGASGQFDDWCDENKCLLSGTFAPVCGNGALDMGEECDPKSALLNTSAKDALCSSSCLWTGTKRPSVSGGVGCGNGKAELGEDCDDGNVRTGDGCSATCTNEGSISSGRPVCGNNTVDDGEECDDENIADGDGCSSKCLNEGTASALCGNGIKETGEDCDWFLLAKTYGDGEAKERCDITHCLYTGTGAPTLCGNSVIDDGESCDPVGGEGCKEGCIHTGRNISPVTINTPTVTGSDLGGNTVVTLSPIQTLAPLTPYRVIINGAVKSETGKPLTGLNVTVGTGTALDAFSWIFTTQDKRCAVEKVEVNPARATLRVIGAKQSYASVPWSAPDTCSARGQRLSALDYGWEWRSVQASVATVSKDDFIPSCGNGRVEWGEQCDDGNIASGDGCRGQSETPGCLWEGTGATQTAGCGNGQLDAGEECDLQDVTGLICTSRCLNGLLAVKKFCNGSLKTNCCGDGTVYDINKEECDDNNAAPGDGCSPFCQKEGTLAPLCGNGVKDTSEECDPEFVNEDQPFCDADTCLLKGSDPSATCGNGELEYGEACDDKNASGDECNGKCLNGGTPALLCGNGVRNTGEDCDDGQKPPLSGDGCSANCLFEGTFFEAPSAALNPSQVRPNMGIDPYQQATAMGLSDADITDKKTSSSTQIQSKVTNAVSDESVSLHKQGEAELTVQCGRKDDTECATFKGGWGIGRGSDSCCRARPSLDTESAPTGSGVCRNALITAVFTAEMDPSTLQGNIILARKYENTAACPAGTLLMDDTTGRIFTLLPNGGFEDAEGWEFQSVDSVDPDDTSPPIARVARDVSHSGRFLLVEAPSATNVVRAVKRITLAGGTKYRLSAFYQVPSGNEDLVKKDAARLSVRRGNIYEDGFSVPVTAARNTWNLIYRDITPPATAEYTIELIAGQEISIYWDDVALSPLQKKTVLDFIPTRGVFRDLVNGARNFVFNLWKSLPIFPAGRVSAALAPLWCTGDVMVTEIMAENFKEAQGNSKTHAILRLNKAMEANADYKVYAIGDINLDDETKEGALSVFGVAMNGDVGHSGAVQKWGFRTGADICVIDHVEINVAPVVGEELNMITKANGVRDLTAQAVSQKGPITPVGGYTWSWGWNDNDTESTLVTLVPKSIQSEAKMTAKTKNGEVIVTAAAKVTDAAAVPSEKDREVAGSEPFTIFICENPWPALAAYPYKDAEMNFSFGFCRDAGGAGTTDDLPIPTGATGDVTVLSLNDPKGEKIPRPSATPFFKGRESAPPFSFAFPLPPSPFEKGGLRGISQRGIQGDFSMAATDSRAEVLKEFLLPFGQDIVGIRVMKNPRWLSPTAWYREQGFIGDPQPLTQPIDGYEAVQDGTTVYIAATNSEITLTTQGEYANKIFSNIYLISYNPDARAEVKNIRDQIVNNFRLAINYSNLRVCEGDISINCSFDNECKNLDFGSCTENKCERRPSLSCGKDADCKGISKGHCSATRDKLSRDITRVKDIFYMSQVLENYKTARGSYPDLSAGSFIRGLTNSQWPSWASVLGNTLGAGLPRDPLSERVGFYGCEGAGYDGYEKNTCWNSATESFKCPLGSQVYQYRALGPDRYELGANFEFAVTKNGATLMDWVGFKANNASSVLRCGNGNVDIGEDCDDSNTTSGDGCSATCLHEGTTLNCGNGSRGTGEDCDDSNTASGDGCSATCLNEGTTLNCGKGSRGTGEDCDDRNTTSGDGCSATCLHEGTIGAAVSLDLGYCGFNEKAYSVAGFCGDGVRQGGTPAEVCEVGETTPLTLLCPSLVGEMVCLRKPDINNTCLSDSDCGVDGPCVKVSAAERTAVCKFDCSGYDAPSDCRPTAYCGDGRKDFVEVCDDGLLNGQYGKCKKDCTARGAYCGNGSKEGPEKCDDGTDNGEYDRDGKCRTDCTGLGEWCGDGVLSAGDEDCDFTVEAKQTTSAETTNGVITSAACPIFDGYQLVKTRTCKRRNGKCTWNNWLACSASGACGNGVKEGAEQCDDGNQDDTDGCTNGCTLPSCGDGKEQVVKICVSGSLDTKWENCGKDSDCGAGGKCQATETCDLGGLNGKICSPYYGQGCSYCTAQCQKAFVKGGAYCGDNIIQQEPEQCDTGGNPTMVASRAIKCVGGTIRDADAYFPRCSTGECKFSCYKGSGVKQCPLDSTYGKGIEEECNNNDRNCNGKSGWDDLGCKVVEIVVRDFGSSDDRFNVFAGTEQNVPIDGVHSIGTAAGNSGVTVTIPAISSKQSTFVKVTLLSSDVGKGTLEVVFSPEVELVNNALGPLKGLPNIKCFPQNLDNLNGTIVGTGDIGDCLNSDMKNGSGSFLTACSGSAGGNKYCVALNNNNIPGSVNPGFVEFEIKAK
ncbi:MAG: Ig-like domain-containing protein [Patescibacteria group bacterium]